MHAEMIVLEKSSKIFLNMGLSVRYEKLDLFVTVSNSTAHLAGAIASETVKPVIGVPADGGPLNGFDSLLSTVQMPKGIPVATVAIGSTGAANAGFLAAQILSLSSNKVAKALLSFREENKEEILEVNKKLSEN